MVWAFFGAVICRNAAVRLAADERIGCVAAMRFAFRKWPGYVAAPLLPIGVVLVGAVVLALLGWLMQCNPGLLVGGLLWPAVIVIGFLMAVLLLFTLSGWPLMWGAISVEGTDSFDALSRSYAYTFQRPMHYLFYVVVAAVVGGLGWILVSNFSAAVVWLGYWGTGWGGADLQSEWIGGAGTAGVWLIHFWVGVAKLLAVGYLFSYFWTASTAIYFQLRHDVDATELDEVFLDADATEEIAASPAVVTSEAGPPATAQE